MTETTTKSAARLLTEAAGIARFPAADGWPPELLPGELAALMAGCRRTDDRKRYDVEYRLIATGIKGGKLQTVTVLRPPSLADTFMAVRRAREPGNSGWATNWDSDAPRRIERIPREIELREVQAIDRASCRTWLDAIKEPPGEYVRAWLGDDCREGAQQPKPAPPASVPVKERRIAAIVETARRLQYDPAKVAWGGKAAIKAECLKDSRLFTDSTFDKAWQAARDSKRVDVEDSETYRKR
jgi:hypothetical protein